MMFQRPVDPYCYLMVATINSIACIRLLNSKVVHHMIRLLTCTGLVIKILSTFEQSNIPHEITHNSQTDIFSKMPLTVQTVFVYCSI